MRSDSAAVGREATQTLLRQGVYKSYGYAGYRTDDDWSRERGKAFRDALDAAGFVGRMFDTAHYKGKVEDKGTLVKWLKALPKPCGILAACDDRAFEVPRSGYSASTTTRCSAKTRIRSSPAYSPTSLAKDASRRRYWRR